MPLCSNVCVVRLRLFSASALHPTICTFWRRKQTTTILLLFVSSSHFSSPLAAACYSAVASALPFALSAIMVYGGGRCSLSWSTITWQCIGDILIMRRPTPRHSMFFCCFPSLTCAQVCSLQYLLRTVLARGLAAHAQGHSSLQSCTSLGGRD